MATITLERIAKNFGATRVLADVSLHIPEGSFFTLLGPSGCGKTTLLRAIAGFAMPDSGRVRFNDEDVTRKPVHARDIGMVFQDYALFPDKSIASNVAYGLHARRLPAETIRARVDEYLERVGLCGLGARFPGELSGGQRQRVALARALAIRPRVLLMDEPLSNLDAKLRVTMRDMIRELQKKAGITTIFVTHDQDEALSMSDRIALLERGRVAQEGRPNELYDKPANAYVADFVGAANLLPLQVVESLDGERIRVRLGDATLIATDARGGLTTRAGMLVARPERLKLLRPQDAEGEANVLKGVLTRVHYLGARLSCQVAIGQAKPLHVEIPAHLAPPALSEGEPVLILVPEASRVLPHEAGADA